MRIFCHKFASYSTQTLPFLHSRPIKSSSHYQYLAASFLLYFQSTSALKMAQEASLYYTSQIKSINLLDSSWVKAVLSYTAPSIRLDSTINLATTQCACIRKAAMKLKSFGYCRALSSNCSVFTIGLKGQFSNQGQCITRFRTCVGMSCLGIFRPSLAIVQVPAGVLHRADRVYTA